MKKWQKITMMILGIIFFIFLIILGLLYYLFGSPKTRSPLEDYLGNNVTKDDNFIGSEAGEHGNNRDGVFNSLGISPTNPDMVYLGTEGNALFKSEDGGKTWLWYRGGIWHNGNLYPEAYDIVFNPKDESKMYMAFTNGPLPPSRDASAGFYRSENGGEYWNRYIEGLPNTGVNSVNITTDGSTLFVGLDGDFPSQEGFSERPKGGIYKSDDGGNTWQPCNIPVKGIYNRFTHINIVGNTIYASGMSFGEDKGNMHAHRAPSEEHSIGLIKSTDKGKTWDIIQPKGSLAYYYDVSSDGQTIIFTDAIGDGIGKKSIDGGITWKDVDKYFSGSLEISPHNKKVIIFGSGGQLSISTDGLESSKKVLNLPENRGIDDIEFTSDPNIVYAAGDGYRLYKSIDGGFTWKEAANLRDFINNY